MVIVWKYLPTQYARSCALKRNNHKHAADSTNFSRRVDWCALQLEFNGKNRDRRTSARIEYKKDGVKRAEPPAELSSIIIG